MCFQPAWRYSLIRCRLLLFFKDIYLAHTAKSELHFLRRGRGVSFHEFELFIAPRHYLDIVSWLHTYLRAYNPRGAKAMGRIGSERISGCAATCLP